MSTVKEARSIALERDCAAKELRRHIVAAGKALEALADADARAASAVSGNMAHPFLPRVRRGLLTLELARAGLTESPIARSLLPETKRLFDEVLKSNAYLIDTVRGATAGEAGSGA